MARKELVRYHGRQQRKKLNRYTMRPSAAETNEGTRVVLYFQVHQPRRLRKMQFLDIGRHLGYFDDTLNHAMVTRIANECYLPVNRMLLALIKRHKNVRLCFSVTGVAIDQFEEHCPEVLHSFRALAETGAVEFLCETKYHSLSSFVADDEFIEQVQAHREQVEKFFGVVPTVFRNTELVYSNSIGSKVSRLGFKGTICDDIDRILLGQSAHRVYRHPLHPAFKILLRNNTLSDDVGFRFIQGDQKLTPEKYVQRILEAPGNDGVVTLGVDYETFGEHKKASTGIVDFLGDVIRKLASSKNMRMCTPSEVFSSAAVSERLDVQELVSWADKGKDITAWIGNEIQRDAFNSIHALGETVRKTNDERMLDIWRNLQTSDHFYYMSTKADQDGEVHSYFSHYHSPYEAFINYMNIVSDFSLELKGAAAATKTKLKYELRHSDVPKWVREYEDSYSQYEGMFI